MRPSTCFWCFKGDSTVTISLHHRISHHTGNANKNTENNMEIHRFEPSPCEVPGGEDYHLVDLQSFRSWACQRTEKQASSWTRDVETVPKLGVVQLVETSTCWMRRRDDELTPRPSKILDWKPTFVLEMAPFWGGTFVHCRGSIWNLSWGKFSQAQLALKSPFLVGTPRKSRISDCFQRSEWSLTDYVHDRCLPPKKGCE